MAIEEALKAVLVADVPVFAVVANRIYPVAMPQDFTLPAITFELNGGEIARGLSGPAGKQNRIYAFRCYAKDFYQARDLMELVDTALDGYSDLTGAIHIHSIIMLHPGEDGYDSDADFFMRSAPFKVRYMR